MSYKGSLAKIGNQHARKDKATGQWGVVHGTLLLDKRFEKAIYAWEWAMWNYKGREGWRLVILNDSPTTQ